ncbi:MAG: PorT family protein [Chitinophagaceae bacterium]|jgi:hypothetical protein|nr:PorT family protein [Chitinophagaceae bacterium]
MKRLLSTIAILVIAQQGFAQTDSTAAKTDTVRVGNFLIIKKNKTNEGGSDMGSTGRRNYDINASVRSIVRTPAKKKNISTNWWIFDLGFANLRDNTNYGFAQAGSYFKTFRPADGPVNQNSYRLNTGKTSNVNIWFFMQKLNVSKHVLNLKYGLGLEMYNFRYDTRLSYRKDPVPFVYNDSIGFSKNKLFASYLTVPLMINVNTTPNKRNGFSFSAGVSAGYLVGSRNKQISGERGKQKINGNFDMEPWRVAAIGELGIGPVRLYGSYSLNRLQKDVTRLEQFPYAIGLRFSNW